MLYLLIFNPLCFIKGIYQNRSSEKTGSKVSANIGENGRVSVRNFNEFFEAN
jgi:hypothetical protein